VTAPTVTVIIPVRDGEQYLEAMSRRVVGLTTPGVDVIIVDDHSTDGTRSRLEAFAESHPDVSVLANTGAAGVAGARNFALSRATGDYIWFADADDSWEPQILQELREGVRTTAAEICVCRADVRTEADQPGRVVDGLDRQTVVDRNEAWNLMMVGRLHGYLWNKLLSRTALGDDPFLPLSSQSDFTGFVVALARADRVAFIPDALYHHIVRDGSVTRSSSHRVRNLSVCVERFQSLAGADLDGLTTRPEFAYFRGWFEVLPMAETPARVGAPWREVAAGGRAAQRELSTLDVRVPPGGEAGPVRRAALVRRLGPIYSITRGFIVRARMKWRKKLS
jgi:glycosyltransferase involved in cell wall biosynthesis